MMSKSKSKKKRTKITGSQCAMIFHGLTAKVVTQWWARGHIRSAGRMGKFHLFFLDDVAALYYERAHRLKNFSY